MTDENTTRNARTLEWKQDKVMLRFLVVTGTALAATIVIVGVVLGVLVYQLDSHFQDLQDARSKEHACLARKEDQFRKDVAHLIAHPAPGVTIPPVDSLQCVIKEKR